MQFHRRFWERRGTVLRAPFPAALLSAEHVFERLAAASERWRAGERAFVPEFCVDHARVLADLGLYLPSSSDRSLEAWTARVTARLGGRAFGLVVDDYQAHDEPVWRRLGEFASGLYARTGAPGDQAKAALFLGNYARTPFGLHRGRSTTFMFVLEGVKRIRAWPETFFRGKEDLTNRLDYERYNDASIVLEGKPGDVIYWPSSYWHIGEDAGGFSVALSLMLFMEPRPWASLGAEVERALASRLGRRMSSVGGALRAVRAVARDRALERALVAARLTHVTGFGFAAVPPPAPARRLPRDAVVRGLPSSPIRWARVGGEFVCSAGGHAFLVPADPRVSRLLQRLNAGRTVRVGDVPAARPVLERLLAFRGVTDNA